jgi:tRNA 2-selenouridine synthase
MPRPLHIDDFLTQARLLPVVDVRSPGEFSKGHIPGAVNICLFSDEERAHVGRLYHEKKPAVAVNAGMRMITPKINMLIDEAKAMAPAMKVLVHCWRGGIRSESFAFLLETAGFEAATLQGGYKAYRHKVMDGFMEPAPFIVLGGMTGSGKTTYLKMIADKGFQVLDIEAVACHKGSVFGGIGQKEQPCTQQFQNDLYDQWCRFDKHNAILVEDENTDIGMVSLPANLHFRIKHAPLIYLIKDKAIRAKTLAEEYGMDNDIELCSAIRSIGRRMGNEHMNLALKAIEGKNYLHAAEILLVYYDKSYHNNITRRPASMIFPVEAPDSEKQTISAIRAQINNIESLIYNTKIRS